MEFGAFWERKMRTFIHRIDVSGDGYVTEKDIMMIGERLIKAGNLTGDQAKEIRQYYADEIWTKYFKPIVGGDKATPEKFMANLKAQGKKNILATTNDIHDKYFKAIDTNKNGVIEPKEFYVYMNVMGVNEEFAEKIFKAIDTDKSGTISREEFIMAGNDFFGQDKEGYPGDLFFGPLL